MSNTLDQFLDPHTGCLTLQVARRMVDWRPNESLKTRIKELGEKADEGSLSEDEQTEYEQYIEDGDLIALLKLKAREILGELPT